MNNLLMPDIQIPYPGARPDWIIEDNKPRPQFAVEHGIGVNYVTICSVSPMDLRCSMRVPAGVYAIPAVAKGEYRCLRVHDTIDIVRDTTVLGSIKHDSELQGQDLDVERGIPAKVRAEDVVRHFIGQRVLSHLGKDGVAIIAGDYPSEQEFKDLVAQQVSTATKLIHNADELAAQRQFNNIMPMHKVMLAWVGDQDPVRHPWGPEIKVSATKNCVACTKLIPFMAMKCEFCQTDILKFYMEHWKAIGVPQQGTEIPIIIKAIEGIANKVNKREEIAVGVG